MVRKVFATVPGARGPMSGKFYYPRHGYGQISDAYCSAACAAGVDVQLGASVAEVESRPVGGAIVHASCGGQSREFPTQFVLSTIPITRLVQTYRPAPPEDILSSGSSLKFRSMMLIYLVLDADRFSEYDAHYFPGADVSITRLSEPKNYGLASLPGTTVLCAELPCSVEDNQWAAADDELKSIVLNDLSRAGLTVRAPVRRVVVRRLKHAYPIYARGYREHFQRLDRWVENLDGVVSLGRQGLFAHDNTHHTLAMAYAASDCISSSGEFDRSRWKQCRDQFESHVVED
jgi:protoporphyrinogen oxidase